MERTIHTLRRATAAIRMIALVSALLVAATPAAAAPVDLIGSPAPDFVLRSHAGPNLRLSEFRTDVVVLTFRADWCGACSRTVAELAGLQARHAADGLQVLTVAVDGHADAPAAGVPLLLDDEQAVSRLYDINRLPVTLLIDRDGRIRHVHDKTNDNAASVAANVAALLAE